MEEYNISLVIFTWFTQSAIGIAIMYSLYTGVMQGRVETEKAEHPLIPLTSLIILVTGLLFSFTHLHYPLHAFNAMNNLGGSWMSREILAEIILLIFMLAWYITIRYGSNKKLQKIFEILVILSGLVLLYFMIRTYMLPSIPELNHPGLPVSFLLTSILSGSSIIYLFSVNKRPAMAFKFKIIASLAFPATILNYIIFASYNNQLSQLSLYSSVYFAGFIAFLPSVYLSFKNKNGLPDVIFLNLAMICDFLNRVFTLTFTNPGL